MLHVVYQRFHFMYENGSLTQLFKRTTCCLCMRRKWQVHADAHDGWDCGERRHHWRVRQGGRQGGGRAALCKDGHIRPADCMSLVYLYMPINLHLFSRLYVFVMHSSSHGFLCTFIQAGWASSIFLYILQIFCLCYIFALTQHSVCFSTYIYLASFSTLCPARMSASIFVFLRMRMFAEFVVEKSLALQYEFDQTYCGCNWVDFWPLDTNKQSGPLRCAWSKQI